MVKTRNYELARGINAFSRAAMARRSGKYKFAKKGGVKKAEKAVETRAPKFYPADDVSKPVKRNFTPKAAKLRASITPGTVLVVLSGRFRGKRVVFLKQLESGLLLVTGT
jgi:large subunit ribosomal protein L6e